MTIPNLRPGGTGRSSSTAPSPRIFSTTDAHLALANYGYYAYQALVPVFAIIVIGPAAAGALGYALGVSAVAGALVHGRSREIILGKDELPFYWGGLVGFTLIYGMLLAAIGLALTIVIMPSSLLLTGIWIAIRVVEAVQFAAWGFGLRNNRGRAIATICATQLVVAMVALGIIGQLSDSIAVASFVVLAMQVFGATAMASAAADKGLSSSYGVNRFTTIRSAAKVLTTVGLAQALMSVQQAVVRIVAPLLFGLSVAGLYSTFALGLAFVAPVGQTLGHRFAIQSRQSDGAGSEGLRQLSLRSLLLGALAGLGWFFACAALLISIPVATVPGAWELAMLMSAATGLNITVVFWTHVAVYEPVVRSRLGRVNALGLVAISLSLYVSAVLRLPSYWLALSFIIGLLIRLVVLYSILAKTRAAGGV